MPTGTRSLDRPSRCKSLYISLQSIFVKISVNAKFQFCHRNEFSGYLLLRCDAANFFFFFFFFFFDGNVLLSPSKQKKDGTCLPSRKEYCHLNKNFV
jgi:hypothetical protein